MMLETRKELTLGSAILTIIAVAAITIPFAINRLNDRIHAPKYAMQTGD
jgi:hypothetical protein